MTFATVSTGFKSGGFNSRRQAPGLPIEFDAEETTSYEVGAKTTLFDGRVTANATLYRTELEGFQEAVLSPTGVGFIVGNAGERRTQGLELDVQANPVEQLSLTASLAYLDAEFTDRPVGPQNGLGTLPPADDVAGAANYNGLTPEDSPEWTGSLVGQWTDSLGIGGVDYFLRGEVAYTDDHFQDAALDPRSLQEAVTILNARIGLEDPEGRWQVALWGKNLTDELYFQELSSQAVGGFISGGGFAGAGGFTGWLAPPLTWGAEATVRF